jgi:hypothetical protein
MAGAMQQATRSIPPPVRSIRAAQARHGHAGGWQDRGMGDGGATACVAHALTVVCADATGRLRSGRAGRPIAPERMLSARAAMERLAMRVAIEEVEAIGWKVAERNVV